MKYALSSHKALNFYQHFIKVDVNFLGLTLALLHLEIIKVYNISEVKFECSVIQIILHKDVIRCNVN